MTSYSGYESVNVEARADGVVIATLNRPERLNAYDGPMRRSIRRLLQEVRDDDSARVLVITGAGRGFCAGADLSGDNPGGWPAAAHEPQFAWCLDLLEMPKPTIAAINGVAAGGGLSMALLCDIRVCSSAARLVPVWLKRAIHPDDLITWTLPRLVGLSRAIQWLYLADDIPLDEAERTGLVQQVLPPDEVLDHALALASRLASGPTVHYALTKQAILRGLSCEPWDAAILEAWGGNRVHALEDSREGTTAFREKRLPEFHGR